MKAQHVVLTTVFVFTIVFGLNYQTATAQSTTTITPINEEISLKKTVIPMSVPEDNIFPWGSVRGQASEIVERYPVIIQIYKGEDAVHFAQVDVKGDGSFEYKFRVQNMDAVTGETINIFEGDYTVNIFRVVPNENSTI